MAMARKIAERYGGDPHEIACKIARNIHYVIEMTSLPQQRNQKRLKGIYELRHNTKINQVEVHQICFYDFLTDRWHWKYTIGEDKIQIGREENWAALQEFQHILQQLATMYPVENGLQAEEGALEVSFHGI